MKNEFVTYELALRMKQLGFDEPCIAFHSKIYGLLHTSPTQNVLAKEVLAPTWQSAFRWFREKHDLQYWLNDGGILGKCFIKITGYKHDKFYFSSSEPMEYEEAELACLEKLIEIVEQNK